MKISHLLPAVLVVASSLSACAHFEQIRLRSNGPSPDTDHCLACTDLGQAWALFRMGAYDQVEDFCVLVLEAESDAESVHARRARDLSHLAKGFLALRDEDYPAAWASLREIRDPRIRDLGTPHVGQSRAWPFPSNVSQPRGDVDTAAQASSEVSVASASSIVTLPAR